MADTSATKARLEKWAQRVFFDAAQSMADKDTRDVPRDTGALAQTRRLQINETAYTASVEYPGDLPNWLEDGTGPHRIDGNPLLAFNWPKAGGVVFLRHVNHPGSRKQVGWFTNTWNEDTFRLFLEFAVQKVAF